MSTSAERMEMVRRLLDDPVVDLSFKDSMKLVYHAVSYEILQARILRLEHKKRGHGTFISDLAHVANFKHQMEQML